MRRFYRSTCIKYLNSNYNESRQKYINVYLYKNHRSFWNEIKDKVVAQTYKDVLKYLEGLI